MLIVNNMNLLGNFRSRLLIIFFNIKLAKKINVDNFPMKLIYLFYIFVGLNFIYLPQYNCNEIESEIENVLKECETLTNENSVICKEMNMKFRNAAKTKFMVEAEFTSNDNSTKEHKNDFFNLALPINTCRSEDCEFCCLSTNRCGTKKQCANSKYYIWYVHAIFISLCSVLLLCLIIKCVMTNSYPDQVHEGKIPNENLNELINMFGIIRHNKKKLNN